MKPVRILFLVAIVISTAALHAQNNPDNVKIDSTIKSNVTVLQQKILLSDNQAAQVTKAIISWLNDNNDLKISSIQNKIESFLDKRQNSKFQIVKDGWWNNLVKEINSIAENKKLNGK